MRTATPYRANSEAMVIPTGPAPTIRTGFTIHVLRVNKVRERIAEPAVLPVAVCNHRERRCQDRVSATLTVWSSGRKIQDSQPDQEAVQQPGIGFARRGIENIKEATGALHDSVGQFAEEGAQSRRLVGRLRECHQDPGVLVPNDNFCERSRHFIGR